MNSVTVIAAFSMPSERGTSKLAFTGEMVADAIHNSLTSIASAASNQPTSICAGRIDRSQSAVLRGPTDVVLSADLLPSPQVQPLRPEIGIRRRKSRPSDRLSFHVAPQY